MPPSPRSRPSSSARSAAGRPRAPKGVPVEPPLEPMLAKLTDSLPPKGDYLYEPKWDGFRALVFPAGGFDQLDFARFRHDGDLLTRSVLQVACQHA